MNHEKYYQVEAKFKGRDWQRNLCRYPSEEAAHAFRRHFIKVAETRIVEVHSSLHEEIVYQSDLASTETM